MEENTEKSIWSMGQKEFAKLHIEEIKKLMEKGNNNNWISLEDRLPEERLDFGDYGLIEQKRYNSENEIYLYKIIGRSKSNTWVDVPVMTPENEVIHDTMEDVVHAVCCGVAERHIHKFKESDVRKK